MNKSFHLKQSYNPKPLALAADEPAIVSSLSWLTQIASQQSESIPLNDSVVATQNGKTETGYLNRTYQGSQDGIVLDVSLESGRRYRLLANGEMYVRQIQGESIPTAESVLQLLPVNGSLPTELQLTIPVPSEDGRKAVGNYFGSSYGGARQFTDYQTSWNTSQLAYGTDPRQFNILTGEPSTSNGAVTALSEYLHTTYGPERLYGLNSTESESYPWQTSIVGSVVTVRRVIGQLSPELAIAELSCSLRVPEGTRRVSCTFTYYGVPVFVYETPQGYRATYVYDTGEVSTVELPESTSNAIAWPDKAPSDPSSPEEFSRIFLGVVSHE